MVSQLYPIELQLNNANSWLIVLILKPHILTWTYLAPTEGEGDRPSLIFFIYTWIWPIFLGGGVLLSFFYMFDLFIKARTQLTRFILGSKYK